MFQTHVHLFMALNIASHYSQEIVPETPNSTSLSSSEAISSLFSYYFGLDHHQAMY